MSETVITDDGARIWAATSGRGPDVVFCHGGPGLWDMLGGVADLLGGDVTAHRWDQRGAGRSEARGPYSVERSVADLDAVRHHFGLARTVVLGHSWGAHLALEYTVRHPEHVRGLIYVSGLGVGSWADWSPEYQDRLRHRLGDRLARWQELKDRDQVRTEAEDREFCLLQWSTDVVAAEHALETFDRLATPWFGVNFESNKVINDEVRRSAMTTDLLARCRALNVPVLIVDGAEDVRPRQAVDSLTDALRDVRRVQLAGAGHLPWIEDPKGFRAAVTGFVAGLAPDPR